MKSLFWQRILARRPLTATPVGGSWGIGGTGASRPGRPRSPHVRLVVREPEAGLWQVAESESESPATVPTPSTVTVAALQEGDAGWQSEVLMSRLAELAVDDELLVVLGSGTGHRHQAVIATLRAQLPRRDVVAVPVRHRHGELLRDAAEVERLLDAGSLPVVVTPAAAVHDVTAEIASYLRADRVLRVLRTTGGADLYPVWRRHLESCVTRR